MSHSPVPCGSIVKIRAFPFEEDPRQSKPRFAVVERRERDSIVVKGVYSKYFPGRTPIPATRSTGLHHDSYLDHRLVRVAMSEVVRVAGYRPAPNRGAA